MSDLPLLPPASAPVGSPYRIAVVCLGNICRSPMAHVVLEDRLRAAGLGEAVAVVSAGTGGWHVGGPMDERAAALLTERGYDASRHVAQQYDADRFAGTALVLAMDAANHADLTGLVEHGRLRMFRDFDPEAGADRDVPDPYYRGDDGFEDVLAMVERTSNALVDRLATWSDAVAVGPGTGR